MGVQNCGAIVKYLMFFFNLLFFLLGIVVLGFGIYARIKQDDYNSALTIIDGSSSEWSSFGSICIAVGIFIALLGGSGCFGAVKEHRGCLIFFTVLVVLVFILEIVAGGLGYAYRGKLLGDIDGNLNKTLAAYKVELQYNNASVISRSWNTVQSTFHCCGKTGPLDFTIPPAACNSTAGTIYPQGCKDKLSDVFTSHWKEWAGGVVGIAVVQLLSIIFSIILIREIGKGDSYTVV